MKRVSKLQDITPEGMSWCSRHKEFLAVSEFNKGTKRWSGLDTMCKACRSEYRKTVSLKTEEQRQKNRDNVRRIVNARRKLTYDLKNVPCADCGKRYPHYVMDFDHLGDKKFIIGKSSSFSRSKILEEVAKCEVVCSNCHRERTHKRQLEKSRPSLAAKSEESPGGNTQDSG